MAGKIAILSDIHGNLEAFTSVLAALESRDIEQYVCLGDLVGYGPDPGTCIEKSREVFRVIVAGNHDHAAAGREDLNYFNQVARAAIVWTMRKLGPEQKEYLVKLPFVSHRENCLLVHSTPGRPEEWNYVLTVDDALRQKGNFQEKVCFIGHSHVPFFFELSPTGHAIPPLPHLEMKDECRYLVNAGSVGQPRDGDPRACFCVYDVDEGTVDVERVSYQMAKTQEKIVRAGLPQFLAQRLALGA